MDPDPMQYVEDPDKKENTDKADAAKAKARLNTLVAISVALLATFMGICKVKDDNIVQAMLQTKSDAVDTWNEYQSKRIKLHLAELGLRQTVALQTGQSIASPTRSEHHAVPLLGLVLITMSPGRNTNPSQHALSSCAVR